MTTLYVCKCGKYDESQDFENDSKDKHGPLNKNVLFDNVTLLIKIFLNYIFLKKNFPANYLPTYRNEEFRSKLDADDLKELRKKRLFEVKISQIMREISVYLLFLFILYVVAFSNLSSSSYQYNQLFLNTFLYTQRDGKLGLNDVKEFFEN
jgi:hypothetical protein